MRRIDYKTYEEWRDALESEKERVCGPCTLTVENASRKVKSYMNKYQMCYNPDSSGNCKNFRK